MSLCNKVYLKATCKLLVTNIVANGFLLNLYNLSSFSTASLKSTSTGCLLNREDQGKYLTQKEMANKPLVIY